MAEALLRVVFKNLQSLVQNEFATISGFKSKAKKLSDTLDLIKAVLKDAEEKQVTAPSKEEPIKVWLRQLKDATYELDDILDECSIESHRLRTSKFKPDNIMFRRKIGKRLKKITRRFDDIAEGKNKFFLRDGVTLGESPIEVAERRQTTSIIAELKVYGREDDKQKIVEFLLTQERGSDFLSIYPVVGLGGLGKTTLCQLVYHDDRVSSHFGPKIWVCVSEVFSVKRILCFIIESITGVKYDAPHLDVIEKEVQKLLRGKRYLLVLDDVWGNIKKLESGWSNYKWEKLKSVLSSCGSKGASILVSTRDKDVAQIMGTCQAHNLSVLSENDCWLLFKQHAFDHETEKREKLVAIGKDIAKKCGGLPLAARALAGLMRSRREEKEWLEIKESRLWSLLDEDSISDDDSILPALWLSYFHLTPTLKQCFSFCAIFPKDTEIMKEDLIHLWIANGFIPSRDNSKVEDVGNRIWIELCQKSFFQDIKIDDYSRAISFKMHDLVHDLAQSVTGSECLFLENTHTNLSRSTHHIAFGYAEIEKGAFKVVESLRTWYPLCFYESLNVSDCIPTHCSFRVLRTSTLKLSLLGSLIHLRYLELYDLDIKTLPNSIYGLRKLEILKLKRIVELSCLPKHLTRLQNLRHLVIEDCPLLSRVFPNVGKLSLLRTLSVYIVKLEEGYNLGELHDLNLLGGKLSIEGLKNVSSLSEAQDANLMGKKYLHELCLSWTNSGETVRPATSPEQVLEVLHPHSDLKRLEINAYDGLCLPSWIGILSSLVEIKLYAFNKCESLLPLGKLPSLKVLKLSCIDKVLYLDDDESRDGVEVRAFPSLEELHLRRLPNLERLLKVERGDMFLCLSRLSIENCPKLKLPSLPSVKTLYVSECNSELLGSISGVCGLTTLELSFGGEMTCLPEGMLTNLTCLQTLDIVYFPKLKELPNECVNLALEHLRIVACSELQYLPERIWKGLRTITIERCGLRSLPEGIQHLTSLEVLTIHESPALWERYKKGTGEDWDKIAHIPQKLITD